MNWKLTRVLLLLVLVLPVLGTAQTVFYTESFETDGEGSRYNSNTFSDCPSPNFFLRTNTNPVTPPSCTGGFSSTLVLSPLQGTFFWAGEDIAGPLPPGSLTSQSINISGQTAMTISLYIACSNNGGTIWETGDSLNIQVNIDGGGFSTVGRFMGTDNFGGNLAMDSNLDGVINGSDNGVLADQATFAKYTFSIPGTGSSMQFNIDFDINGGTEEIAVDLIEVSGVFAPPSTPEINLVGNGQTINDGDLSPTGTDHTSFGSVLECTGTISRTFTIQNSGPAVLNLTGTPRVQVSGTNAADFTVTSQPTATVAASGGSTTFTVQFDPSGTGTRSATLTIDNDDTDENPYDFAINGAGLFDVVSPTVMCPANQTEAVNSSCQVSLPDYSSLVTTSDNCPGSVTLTQTPAIGTIVSGVGTTISVSMLGRDASLNASTCTFTTTLVGSEINVQYVNSNVLDGSTAPTFGNQLVCTGNTEHVFVVHNTSSTTALNISGVTVSGANAGDFTITGSPAATIAPNDSSNLTVRFDPTAVGPRSASIDIANDDCDESLYNFTVEGVGDPDNVNPIVTCPPNQTYNLGAACQGLLPDYRSLVTSSDNCGSVTETQTPSPGTTISGTVSVTVSGRDAALNASSCTFSTVGQDTTSPTVTCQDISVVLGGTTASITAGMVTAASGDNCALAGASVSPSSFTCSNIGANNVTLTVTDVNSNTANCTAVVTVQDTTQPTAVCQNITTFIQVNDTASITAGDIDNGSSDNCSFSLGISQSDFTCNDLIGTQSVTLTVSDNSGNIDSCTAQVTVQDTAGYCCATPILAGGGQTDTVCLSGGTTFVLTSSGDVDSLRWEVSTNNGSTWSILTDAMPNYASTTSDSLVIGGAPFSFDNNQYRLVAYGCGATVMSTPNILKVDPVPPNALCQDISIHLDGAGMASIAAGDIDNGSNDACGTVSLVASQTAFTCAELGGNPVLLTVTDTVGNTDTCSATVTVIDSIAPVMATLDCGTSNAEDAIYDNGWQSGDNDGSGFGPWTLTASTGNTAQAGHFVGTSTANGSAVDSNSDNDIDSGTRSLGMYANSSQGVDATRPIIGTFTIGSQLRVEMDNGFVDPGQLAVFQLQNASGNSLGEVRFRGGQSTYEVIDLNGLTPIAGFPFTDEGIIIEVTAGPTGLANVSVTRKVDGVGQSFVMTLFAGGGDQTIGRFKIVNSNNGVGAASNLYVNNMSACILSPNCPSNVSTTTQPGICGAVVAYDSVVAVDNCTGITAATQTTGLANGATFPLGTTNNTFTGTDVSGNTASCGFTVTVADGTPPTANCQNITVVLDGSGSASIVAADIDSSSTDACGIMSYSISDTSFTCADIGANTVTLMVTDSNSNAGSCTATVTVQDTLPPIAVCQNITVQLDSTGLATLAPSQIDSSSSDACGIMNLSVSDTLFNCSDVGANSVTLTVTDSSGNSSNCTAIVTVEDNTPPVAACQNLTVFLDGSGSATIVSGDVDSGSSDVCGIDNLVLSMTSFACANVGPNSVTLTVTDNSGNVDTCSAVVTVNDSIPPVASCQNATVFLDGSGNATITPAAIDSNSTDACGILSVTLSDTSFACADIGANGVTLTVTDNNGNSATCSATVTVTDSIAPSSICQDITVVLDSNGMATLVPSQIDNNSTDACGIMNLSISDTSFTCSDVGANTVTLFVTDSSSNISTCTSTVTVEDNTPPVAVCQNVTVFLNGSGSATITTGDIDNGSSDVCGINSRALSMTSFACANVGPNSVTLTVTDNSGNVDTCSAVVTVNDSIPPVASCQNATVFLDGSGNATITAAAIDSSSTDACGIMSLALSDTSFSCADVGANGVTLTVTDNNGNTATCTATVTVNDSIPPTAICNNITVQLDSNGLATLAPSQIDSSSFDVCGIMNFSVSDTLFTCSDVGANSVTLTVTDSSSNSSTCTATVTVEDNTPPVAACQNITVFLDGSGSATITTGDVDNGSSDVCGIDSLMLSMTSFACANVGPNSVTLTVTDNSGNVDTCSAVVTVNDSIPPVASCQNTTVFLDGSGNATITAAAIDSSSNDACGIMSLALSDTSFSCADVGANGVTLTVTDNNGNTATCTATVTVNDSIAPTAICNNITVQLDSNGLATLAPSQIDSSSFDVCGIMNFSVSDTLFTCSDVGANSVTLTVTDSSSNSSTCTATVTVEDNTPPVAACQNITVFLDGSGSATITTGDVDNGSSDVCGIDSLMLSMTSFACANVGPNSVTLTVTDNSGNVDTCSAVVTVNDSIPPVASCQNATVFLDGSGNATITAAAIDSSSTDACGIMSLALSDTSFSCADVGANGVTLTVTDNNGNTATCTATVTVNDSIAPTAICNNITVQLDSNGLATLAPSQIDSSSFDVCGIMNFSVSDTLFTCSDVGANSVTLTVTDSSSNSSTCTATVTVEDNTPPVAACQNITVFLDGSGSATITTGDVDNGSSDVCGIDSLMLSMTSFACANVGPNSVTLTVTDNSGNVDTCSAVVTVNDSIPPVANCQNATVFLDGSGNATITAAAIDSSSTDACGIMGLALSDTSFTCADRGANGVTLTVTDNNGNTATCTATVTVNDSIPPTPICQNITVQLDSNGLATLVPSQIDSSSFDVCGIMNLSVSDTLFTCSNLGSNTVTLTVTDSSSNSSTCTATVTVEDNLAPNANCQSITVFLDGAGSATITSANIDNGSTDNCTIDSMVVTPSAFSCSDVGANSVTLLVTDQSGNTDTCSATVTVTDSIAPTAICQNTTIYLDGSGNASLTATQVDSSSFDVCGIANIAVSDTAFNCADIGTNTVTLTVTDSSGNMSTCTSTVTVEDSIAPTPICQNLTLQLDSTGFVGLSAAQVDSSSFDNCGSVSLMVSDTAFSCAHVGTNTVTLTVTDDSGNASTCTSTITVEDNVLPNVVCQNDTLYLNGSGSGSIVAGDIDNGSSDACGIDTMVVNPNSFNCGNIGANAVTLFVTDNNGNMDSCSATVTVIDSIAPTAICQNITVLLDSAGNASIIPSQIDSLSFDACGIDSMSVSPSTFNCGNVGTNTVTLTLTDSSGNASTCTGTVTIEDSIPPVALCQNITVYLDTAGMASINVAQIDSGSTDACGIDSLVISNSMFDCNNTVASLSVLPELLISEYIEGSGFEKYIEIYNGTGQTVDLSNYELRRYTNGSATVSASNALTPGGMLADGASVVFKNGSATGFAGGIVLSVVNWNGDDAVELFNTNTGLTVDIFGNIGNDPGSAWTGGGASTANQTLRRKATVSGGVTVNPGGSGPAAFTTLATEWDNFPINDVSGLGAHTVSLSGSNSVTLTVTDVNGNVSTCIAEVTVIDSISPTVNCSNITVQLDTAGNATIVTGDVGTSTDECGITSEVLSQSVFACGDLGANSITYTATDANGNATSCVGVVTIEDTLPPVWVNCPGNDSVFADSASCASSVVWTAPSVSDNCSIASSSNNFNSGDPFPIGNTTVSYIATDSSGNSDSCTFVITVTAQPLLATVTIPTTACGFNLNCAADNNGTATVAPNGGCLPYQYAWSNGDTSAMASNLSAGTYYVTVTDSLGTVWTDSLNVTAPMPLALTHVADSLICGNDTTGTIDLSVTGGNTCAAYSFLWSTGATTEDISGLMAGTYTVTVTDTLGCMAVLSHTFMQGIVPTPNLGVDTAKCPNTAIILQLDSAYAGYMWSTGDSTSTTSVIATGTYWVEVSSAEGCVGSDTIVVTDFVVDNDIITTMGSLTICDGDSVVMVADSGLTNWVWSTGGTTATEVIAGFGGPVTLTANDANGCVVTDTETVNYVQFTDPIPVITPGPTATLCDGDEMNLNVQTGYFSYLWSNGETTQTILINTPGLYQVTVSNGFGCEAVSDPVTVTGVPLPTATLALSNGVLSTTTPFSSYQWYMDGNIIAGAIQPTYTPTMAGWYSVMVSDSNGCSGNSDSIYVNPVSIDTELLELEGLVLYPNPSSGLVNLRTEHPIPGKMEIEVWDMYGQKVKVFKLSQLISDVDFDLTDIANGMYLMKISTKRGQQRSATMIRFMIE